jgi:hypothetical protein
MSEMVIFPEPISNSRWHAARGRCFLLAIITVHNGLYDLLEPVAQPKNPSFLVIL